MRQAPQPGARGAPRAFRSIALVTASTGAIPSTVFRTRLLCIKVGDGRRLRVIGIEPGFECLGIVVGAHRSAARKRLLHAIGNPGKQCRLVHLEFNDGIEIHVFGAQHFGQGLGLTHCARKAVQR